LGTSEAEAWKPAKILDDASLPGVLGQVRYLNGEDHMLETLQVKTPSRCATIDITDLILHKVRESGIRSGLCLLQVPHTTAGILVNEGADPAVMEDVLGTLEKMVPWQASYNHSEGNSAAHIKAIMTGGRTFLMIADGRLVLGTWERVFLCEFDGPRTRKVLIKIMKEV
jgi:secondary thiamine-phosphate synthase enzyme